MGNQTVDDPIDFHYIQNKILFGYRHSSKYLLLCSAE